MKIKFIHYTEKEKYLKNIHFIPAFQVCFRCKKKFYQKLLKYGTRWIGDLGEYHIIIKKMTKKEMKKEIRKNIKSTYKLLKECGIPFIPMIKFNKNKVMLCKFYGLELWKPIPMDEVKVYQNVLKEIFKEKK